MLPELKEVTLMIQGSRECFLEEMMPDLYLERLVEFDKLKK